MYMIEITENKFDELVCAVEKRLKSTHEREKEDVDVEAETH